MGLGLFSASASASASAATGLQLAARSTTTTVSPRSPLSILFFPQQRGIWRKRRRWRHHHTSSHLQPPQEPNHLQRDDQHRAHSVIQELLDRRWMLPRPDAQIHQIRLSAPPDVPQSPLDSSLSISTRPLLGDGVEERGEELQSRPCFYIVRDDLLHPLVNGNKARKLDAILPVLEDHRVTDVVTCGGCQSAHTAATAVSCAERGIRSHLLLRGEQPDIPTGYNLVSLMYGNVSYVPRSLYAKREQMLRAHADLLAVNHASVHLLDDLLSVRQTKLEGCLKKVVIVNEGAGDTLALLGVVRLIRYLSQTHLFGKRQPIRIVVDAGTGTTAIGLALGITCLRLPWEVVAVMLSDSAEGYQKREKQLISNFKRVHGLDMIDNIFHGCNDGFVRWVERMQMRRFGQVLPGEIDTCQRIAQQTGVLVDPIYTLAAWQHAVRLSQEASSKVVMLHTGGTLGMFGLAQRYKPYFQTAQKLH